LTKRAVPAVFFRLLLLYDLVNGGWTFTLSPFPASYTFFFVFFVALFPPFSSCLVNVCFLLTDLSVSTPTGVFLFFFRLLFPPPDPSFDEPLTILVFVETFVIVFFFHFASFMLFSFFSIERRCCSWTPIFRHLRAKVGHHLPFLSGVTPPYCWGLFDPCVIFLVCRAAFPFSQFVYLELQLGFRKGLGACPHPQDTLFFVLLGF